MATRKRLPELSWLNVAFCAAVVWIHALSYPATRLVHESWQYALVYSVQQISFVAVYGFFFLSGLKLTLFQNSASSPATLWTKRVKTLLLPYILAAAVYYAWFTIIRRYFPPSLFDFLGYLIRGDLSAPFYFLVALIQFIFLTPLLIRLVERFSPIFIIPASILISLLSSMYLNDILQLFVPEASFPYSDRLFTTYLVYYLSGCCAGSQYSEFLRILKKNKSFITSTTIIFGADKILLCWYSAATQKAISFYSITSMLFHLSAILTCFHIAVRLPQSLPRWLAKIDRASFLIYLYHSLALLGIDAVLRRLGITKLSVVFILRALFTFIAAPLACVLWQELWARVKLKLSQKQNHEKEMLS